MLAKIFNRIKGVLNTKSRKDELFRSYVFNSNSRYDLQTFQIIEQVLNYESNTIDIGAHKGAILEKLISAASGGKHFAFEPIPELYNELKKRHRKKVSVYPFALGEEHTTSTFNYVNSNPAYSGLLKRKYDRPESDSTIEVEVRKLDEIVPSDLPIDLIKIDVEGAEFGVVKGGIEVLKKWHPIVIYEQGLGGADVYGTDPGDYFDFMQSLGYKISLMEYYLGKKQPLSKEEYCSHFWKGYNYYFIAY